jgi:hypothetical protein
VDIPTLVGIFVLWPKKRFTESSVCKRALSWYETYLSGQRLVIFYERATGTVKFPKLGDRKKAWLILYFGGTNS